MTEADYLAVYVRTDARHCSVEALGDLEYPGDLNKCIPLASTFPNGLKVDLDPGAGDMVTDFVNNSFRVLIASQKARAILESEGVERRIVEYLPIVLRDKRRKPLKGPFFVVNVLASVPCFDWKRSTYQTYPNKPRKISPSSLTVLHVVPEAIPPDAKLFRVDEVKRELVVRADLLERIKREGCEGLCVVPMGEERI